MSFKLISAGKNIPDECHAVIEIAMHSDPVKYEIDHDSGVLWLDRFMPTALRYPCNYGYIPQTLADDGDPLDVLVLTPYPLIVGTVLDCCLIGMLEMEDEGGGDFKLLAVPTSKALPEYGSWKEITDVPVSRLNAIKHFFSHYKDLDQGKWVKIGNWLNAEAAKSALMAAVKKATDAF